MTATARPAAATEPAERTMARVPRAGWTVVAGKEIGDHVSSIRFVVLLIVLGIAAGIPLYFAADTIREAAERASEAAAVFLALFTIGEDTGTLVLRVDSFVAFVAPLLGIIFAFDAINSERHDGTLPRLLSQPIHRDDVINGKFAAGLAVIGIVLVAMLAIVSGYGMFRLGIVPETSEVFRLLAWTASTVLYVSLWLAFGLLLSVAIRNAATAALVGFGTWLFLALFGSPILRLIAPIVAPITGATDVERYETAVFQDTLTRLLPETLYREISVALLNPSATQVSAPATIGQAIQANQQVGTLLSLDQSLLIVWPQIVALVALTVICFGAAYVLFMRQEVRA
jgi:ABC-2 type transport system permease protein